MTLISPQHRATLRWIFRGPNGIRAGWGVLIFILILAVPTTPLRLYVAHHHLMPKGEIAPGLVLINDAMTLALILAATAIMARIEKRSVWSYGLSGRRRMAHFLAGCLGGFLCLSLLVGILYAGDYLSFDGLALHGPAILAYGLIWFAGFILVGMAEETMFRGYLQYTLARGVGFWPAAVILSLLFAALHIGNHGENVFGILQVVAAGLALSLLLRVSGSLWLSIGFHTAWDWAQSYFYGTPDSGLMMKGHLFMTHATGNPRFSGGTAGPEGSMLATPLLILGPLLIAYLCRRAGLLADHNNTIPTAATPLEA